MVIGPSDRRRKGQRAYVKYLKDLHTKCDFCDLTDKTGHVVESPGDFRVIKNLFPYDVWDDIPVSEHLLLVPKRHIVGINEMTASEKDQFFELLSKYEKRGYSIYARAPADIAKSVAHQHTHLIKLGTKRTFFKVYLRKPHVLIYK